VPVPVPAPAPVLPLPLMLASARMYCELLPLVPWRDVVSPAVEPLLPERLAGCRQPVTVTVRSLELWPLLRVWSGCCALTPMASAALSIVPKMNCLFIETSVEWVVQGFSPAI
jgi:hypothetical protein